MANKNGRLEGKVAIVTGAGSRGPGVGNGKATSVLFAREGAKVLLVDNAVDHAVQYGLMDGAKIAPAPGDEQGQPFHAIRPQPPCRSGRCLPSQ